MMPHTDVQRQRRTRVRPLPQEALPSPASPPRFFRGWEAIEIATAVAASLAIVFRCRMYLVGRSLWLDETALALNICGRTFGELIGRLDHDQGAPIGFLWAVKLATTALGNNELALRLVPFLASLATLALVYRLAAGPFGRVAGVIALTLAGFSPALIYYAGELKQYGCDVAVALSILVVTTDVAQKGLSRGRLLTLGLVGVASVWFSHPAVFVLAGVGSALIGAALLARRTRDAALLVGVSAAWLVSFATVYVLFLRDLGSNSFLAEFWEGAFLPMPPRSPRDLRVYVAVLFGLFEAPFQNIQVDVDLAGRMGVFTAALGAIGVGALALPRERRTLLAVLAGPVLFGLVAAMLHKYPLKGRLALFTVASTLPIVAAGLAELWASREPLARLTARVMLGFALFLPAVQATQFLLERPRLHDARGVLGEVAQAWQPGDIVVVDRYSALPFNFYQTYGNIPVLDQVSTTETELSMSEPDQLAREATRWKGNARVWFILDNALPDPTSPGRAAQFLALDHEGSRLKSFTCRRYSAHLYRLD